MIMYAEALCKATQKRYMDFILYSQYYRHGDTGKTRREVYVYNISAPLQVSRKLQLLMVENKIKYFTTSRDAERLIQKCYK